MSWWIYLEDSNGTSVSVERHEEGGTYVRGGTTEAELNVTYNYGKHFDFQKLHGLSGKEASGLMAPLIERLGTYRRTNYDYWEPTPGNVGRTLMLLKVWADQYPEARFRVS